LDTADLDFGIYRLLAARRQEVERFINEELPASVEAAFGDLLGAECKGIVERIQECKASIILEAEDEKAVLPDGTVNPNSWSAKK
jgi:adenine-specific DNA-methyltransferase